MLFFICQKRYLVLGYLVFNKSLWKVLSICIGIHIHGIIAFCKSSRLVKDCSSIIMSMPLSQYFLFPIRQSEVQANLMKYSKNIAPISSSNTGHIEVIIFTSLSTPSLLTANIVFLKSYQMGWWSVVQSDVCLEQDVALWWSVHSWCNGSLDQSFMVDPTCFSQCSMIDISKAMVCAIL